MDLWRQAMAKIKIDAPPLYHRNSGRLGTTLSFHSTTKHAQYKERGQHIGLALARLCRPTASF